MTSHAVVARGIGRKYPMNDLTVAGMVGSAIGGGVSAAAINSNAPVPPGMEWMPWVTALVSAFGPVLLSLFLRWRFAVAEEKRRRAAQLLADTNKANDEEARKLESDAANETMLLKATEKLMDTLPPKK